MHDMKKDDDLSAELRCIVELLSSGEVAEIDQKLISTCTGEWQKIAKVVGIVMGKTEASLPDVYFARRIRSLIEQGIIEKQGCIETMRYCEIRLVYGRGI